MSSMGCVFMFIVVWPCDVYGYVGKDACFCNGYFLFWVLAFGFMFFIWVFGVMGLKRRDLCF